MRADRQVLVLRIGHLAKGTVSAPIPSDTTSEDEAVLAWLLDGYFRETADSFALLRPLVAQSAVFARPY
jgi:hypothetical protein